MCGGECVRLTSVTVRCDLLAAAVFVALVLIVKRLIGCCPHRRGADMGQLMTEQRATTATGDGDPALTSRFRT